jgi:hypothetical protein
MDALIWILLPLITAVGSALLSFYIMQARMEVVVAKEREALVEARTVIKTHAREVEDRVKMAEEAARRSSLDDFLADIRVEERHYMRENKSLFSNTKSMILQERLYFRNLPLSNWVEHELTVEQGQTADLASLAQAASVFSAQGQQALAESAAAMEAMQAMQTQQQPSLTRVSTGAPSGMGPQAMAAGPATRAATTGFGTGFGANASGRAFGSRQPAGMGLPPLGSTPRGNDARANTARTNQAELDLTGELGAAGRLSFAPRLSQSRLVRG